MGTNKNHVEVLLVGVDFSNSKDINVLTVGTRENGITKLLRAFQGEKAEKIYKLLTED